MWTNDLSCNLLNLLYLLFQQLDYSCVVDWKESQLPLIFPLEFHCDLISVRLFLIRSDTWLATLSYFLLETWHFLWLLIKFDKTIYFHGYNYISPYSVCIHSYRSDEKCNNLELWSYVVLVKHYFLVRFQFYFYLVSSAFNKWFIFWNLMYTGFFWSIDSSKWNEGHYG